MAERAHELATRVLGLPSAPDMARAAATAIVHYTQDAPVEHLSGEGVVFVVVALTSLARALAQG
jgi:hypothetical protein